MYPTDFEADTSHLTLEEDGAYNRLLRLMWMTPGCSLPDDDRWIQRRMRVDLATYERVIAPVIAEFLERKNGRVFSVRLRKEWKKVDETSRKRSEAGKKGGRPKDVENKQKEQKAGFDFVKAGPKQPEPEPEPYKKETKVSQKKRATSLSENWVLPDDFRDWATGEGWPESVVLSEADIFRDYWIGVDDQRGRKKDWFATWRNWMRRSNSPKVINGGKYEDYTPDILSKWADRVNGEKYLPELSDELRHKLLAENLVTPERMKERIGV
jgi:uncharacterized protein YdaU (DUF1376 family)